MASHSKWRRYLRFWRPDPERDVDDELRTHLELRVAALVARGLTPAEAGRQALDEFGDVEATRARLLGAAGAAAQPAGDRRSQS